MLTDAIRRPSAMRVLLSALLVASLGCAAEEVCGDVAGSQCQADATDDVASWLQRTSVKAEATVVANRSEAKEVAAQRALLTRRLEDYKEDAKGVKDCFDDETKRQEAKAWGRGFTGILTSGLSGFAASASGGSSVAAGGIKLLGVQDRDSQGSKAFGLMAAVGLATFAGGALDAGFGTASEIDELANQNCHQLAAGTILKELHKVEGKVDAVQTTVNNIEDIAVRTEEITLDIQTTVSQNNQAIKTLSDDIYNGVTKLSLEIQAAHSTAMRNKDLAKSIESSLREQMLATAQAGAALAKKLDILTRLVVQNGEKIDVAAFEQLSARFGAALAGVSGAFDDYLSLSEGHQALNGDLASRFKDPEMMLSWAAKAKEQRRVDRMRLQDIFGRSRDHLATAVSVLGDGGLARRHYELLLSKELDSHIQGLKSKHGAQTCEQLFNDIASGDSELMKHLRDTVFGGDELLGAVIVSISMAGVIHDVFRIAFPMDYQATRGFLDNVKSLTNIFADELNRLSAGKTRAGSTGSLLAHLFNIHLPVLCPVTDSCVAAAFAKGITATETLVALSPEVFAVGPGRLLGNDDPPGEPFILKCEGLESWHWAKHANEDLYIDFWERVDWSSSYGGSWAWTGTGEGGGWWKQKFPLGENTFHFPIPHGLQMACNGCEDRIIPFSGSPFGFGPNRIPAGLHFEEEMRSSWEPKCKDLEVNLRCDTDYKLKVNGEDSWDPTFICVWKQTKNEVNRQKNLEECQPGTLCYFYTEAWNTLTFHDHKVTVFWEVLDPVTKQQRHVKASDFECVIKQVSAGKSDVTETDTESVGFPSNELQDADPRLLPQDLDPPSEWATIVQVAGQVVQSALSEFQTQVDVREHQTDQLKAASFTHATYGGAWMHLLGGKTGTVVVYQDSPSAFGSSTDFTIGFEFRLQFNPVHGKEYPLVTFMGWGAKPAMFSICRVGDQLTLDWFVGVTSSRSTYYRNRVPIQSYTVYLVNLVCSKTGPRCSLRLNGEEMGDTPRFVLNSRYPWTTVGLGGPWRWRFSQGTHPSYNIVKADIRNIFYLADATFWQPGDSSDAEP